MTFLSGSMISLIAFF